MCRGWPRAPTPRHAASGPRRARRANGSGGRSRMRRSPLDCTTAATIAAFWTSPSTRTSASRARCPRASSDPEIFRAQRERIFARTWQWAAHDEVVKVAGQVYPFTLLPGALDEPLLLTRDANDQVHCLSNVCTHRGTLVVEGAGHETQLRCRYHGRRFTLDGRFHSMPEFDGAKGFPSKGD